MKVTLDFHKSSEERPEKSCEVIAMNLYKNISPLLVATDYSKKHNLFNACDYEKYTELYAQKEALDAQMEALMEQWEALAEEAGE